MDFLSIQQLGSTAISPFGEMIKRLMTETMRGQA